MSARFCLAMLAFSLWGCPETRALTLDEVQGALRAHWLWRRWVPTAPIAGGSAAASDNGKALAGDAAAKL